MRTASGGPAKWFEHEKATAEGAAAVQRKQREENVSNEVRRFIEQPTEPVERILVGDRGHWIQKHGEPAGDRRRQPSFVAGLQVRKSEHGASCACARRFESEPVERDEPRAIKLRPEVSPRKDERDGNAPHPTP